MRFLSHASLTSIRCAAHLVHLVESSESLTQIYVNLLYECQGGLLEIRKGVCVCVCVPRKGNLARIYLAIAMVHESGTHYVTKKIAEAWGK